MSNTQQEPGRKPVLKRKPDLRIRAVGKGGRLRLPFKDGLAIESVVYFVAAVFLVAIVVRMVS